MTANHDNKPTNPAFSVYSAPRRFDLATLMVITVAYGILFAILRALRFPPAWFLIIAGFLTSVGLAQALLFGGKQPRLSSVIVGVVYSAVSYVLMVWFSSPILPDPQGVLFGAICIGVFAGPIFGYLGGLAVGAVFMIPDRLRKLFGRFKRR